MEKHDKLCYVAQNNGNCCPWLPECDCQCMCDWIADIRKDERFYATRDAVHVVEELLNDYSYDSEGYRAITTAGNRLRILTGGRDE